MAATVTPVIRRSIRFEYEFDQFLGGLFFFTYSIFKCNVTNIPKATEALGHSEEKFVKKSAHPGSTVCYTVNSAFLSLFFNAVICTLVPTKHICQCTFRKQGRTDIGAQTH